MLDTSDLMCDAADALIDDSFFRCFTSAPPDPWNWNWYLWPQWAVGCVLRYCILFPLRLTLLLIAMCLGLMAFFGVQAVLRVRRLLGSCTACLLMLLHRTHGQLALPLLRGTLLEECRVPHMSVHRCMQMQASARRALASQLALLCPAGFAAAPQDRA